MPTSGTGTLYIAEDTKHHHYSTDRAFLPAKLALEHRARLNICTDSLVACVELLTECDEARAIGMHFEATNSRNYFAKARREVVLCSDVLRSPWVLVLSGLRPKEHLQRKNTPIICDLPEVGTYLVARSYCAPLTFEVPITVSESLHILEVSPMRIIKLLLTYLVTTRGAPSYPFQNASMFIPSCLLDDNRLAKRYLNASIPEIWPDMEFMYIGNNCTDADIPRTGLFIPLSANIRPKSMVIVRPASSNSHVRPDIDLGYFNNPEDYVPLRKSIRLSQRVAVDVRVQGYPLKDFIVPEGSSDDVLDAYIRANLRTCFHYTSTRRISAETHGARPSIVGTHLRAHGVKRLRVHDASVFQGIVGGHTMAPAVMVAEKCADILRTASVSGS